MKMRRRCCLVWGLLLGILVSSPLVAAEPPPPMLLTVIHIKPGESTPVELALPQKSYGNGRDGMHFSILPRAADEKERAVDPELIDGRFTGRHRLDEGLVAVWQSNKPGISVLFQASEDAEPRTVDLRMDYRAFGVGNFTHTWRIVIDPAEPAKAPAP